MNENLRALKADLEDKYNTRIYFPENHRHGGTNNIGTPFHLFNKEGHREDYFAMIVQHPKFNPEHGVEADDAVKRLTYFKLLQEYIENSEELVDGQLEKNLVNSSLPKIYDISKIKVHEKPPFEDEKVDLEKAYYISEIGGEVTKFDPAKAFDSGIAVAEGRIYAGFSKYAEKMKEEKDIDYAEYLHGDPYSPHKQLEKLKAILEDETRLFNVGKGIMEKDLDKDYYDDIEARNAGKKLIEGLISLVEKTEEVYDTLHGKLKKSLDHGDPYYDNILKKESETNELTGGLSKQDNKIIDIVDAGEGFVISDIALAISARGGINEDGTLNKVGKFFTRGHAEVMPLDEDFEKYFHLFAKNGETYIATMRIGKWAMENYDARNPIPKIENAAKYEKYFEEGLDIGLDRNKDLTPNPILNQEDINPANSSKKSL